jgi:amidase
MHEAGGQASFERLGDKESLMKISGFLLVCGLYGALDAFAAANTDVTGRWELTTTTPSGSYVAGVDLTADQGKYTGKSGWLIPDWGFFFYTGSREKNDVHLRISYEGGSEIGELIIRNDAGTLKGSGTIHGIAVTVVGHRPLKRPANASTVHDFEPKTFWSTFSGATPPALHVFPGDTVRTKTVDAYGRDEHEAPRALPSANPQTGPFYVEGAMPGDTLAVHFTKIRPNRNSATQYREAIDPSMLKPGQSQQSVSNWSRTWTLDREKGIATPDNPSEKLKNFSVKLEPMLGCVSVAPFWNQAIGTADLGPWGGNLDYNQIREGTTLYLPVYQAGALLTIGDGHARQGDGEITGQGLETSMDVEFKVDVVHGDFLNQPWAENDDYVMVSGIEGSLTTAMQSATSGLSKWLAMHYGLSSPEITTVLANTVRYDIAEAGDPHIHVVAKIGKDILQQIRAP